MKAYIDEVWQQAKNRRIKSWMKEEHPNEFGYDQIDEDLTFDDLFSMMLDFKAPECIYEIDSEPRGKIFNHLGRIYDLDYDIIMGLWMTENSFDFIGHLKGKKVITPEE
jgi:hypothetical protein